MKRDVSLSEMTPIQVRHSEWVAALRDGDDVASVVALAVLDDLAPLIFPRVDCQHDWRAYEDEATKAHGDQEWTCALCGEEKVLNPPVECEPVEDAL